MHWRIVPGARAASHKGRSDRRQGFGLVLAFRNANPDVKNKKPRRLKALRGFPFTTLTVLPDYLLVPKRGLEPPHLAAHGPEPCASTNSATWANRYSEECYFSERFKAVNGRVRNGSKRTGKRPRGSQRFMAFLAKARNRQQSPQADAVNINCRHARHFQIFSRSLTIAGPR